MVLLEPQEPPERMAVTVILEPPELPEIPVPLACLDLLE
jgi:hypothetical protein